MISYRRASAEDAQALGHLHVEGWRGAYGGALDQNFLDTLSPEEKAENWNKWLSSDDGSLEVIIAEDDGKPCGFVAYGKIQTPPAGQSKIRPTYSAEVLALYLLPDYYRRGSGRQLLSHVAKRLWELKHGGMALWVLESNKRACDFYAALGGQRVGKEKKQIGPNTVLEVCYAWRDPRRLICA